jgi:hypothetical protein
MKMEYNVISHSVTMEGICSISAKLSTQFHICYVTVMTGLDYDRRRGASYHRAYTWPKSFQVRTCTRCDFAISYPRFCLDLESVGQDVDLALLNLDPLRSLAGRFVDGVVLPRLGACILLALVDDGQDILGRVGHGEWWDVGDRVVFGMRTVC